MNARLYDPTLGKFLSADTIIPSVSDTQSYNRYSYVKNNPLKYTDPTGHSWLSKLWKKFKKYIKTIITIAVVAIVSIATAGSALVAGMHAFWGAVTTGAVAGFTGGVVGTLLNGGSLAQALRAGFTGALFGGLSAGLAYGVAEMTASVFHIGSKAAHSLSLFHTGGKVTATLFKAVAHGISRAIITKAQGGRWSSGFWSGFASSAFSVGTKGYGGITGRTMIMAGVGGTVSELTGGKFANGAVSGAFVHLFNAEVKNFIAEARRKALELSIDKIISSFEKMRNLPLAQRLMLLYKFTKNGSILDFKQENAMYQDYGNFTFGAVGSALDIDDAILLRGAGWAQTKAGTSQPEWGTYYGFEGSYGDDPHDQEMIKYGIQYYHENYRRGQ